MDNREAIIKTIDKIAQLSKQPGNEWLQEELKHRWGDKESIEPVATFDAIDKIEKYLAIDYNIDSIGTKIDYSFVKTKVLRLQLEADWREMLRYRCGLRAHKVDYEEYCRYASMQAEGMTNYFMQQEKRVSSVTGLNSMIDGFNQRLNNKQPSNTFQLKHVNELKNLPYTTKYCIMVNTLIENGVLPDEERVNITMILSKIYKFRNKQSHRGGEAMTLPEVPPDMDSVELVLMEIAIGLKEYLKR